MTSPKQIVEPPNTAGDVLKTYWRLGQKTLAAQTEQQIREKNPSIKLWSCECEKQLERFITNDPDMIAMKSHVQQLQKEQDPVLIVGPTGTGKELIARALHGSRSGKFVAVNCTSMPDELLESELFGHVKGAFTGAVGDRVGKFRNAFNGTIFLDEIGDMPLSMQVKLLRVLQEYVVNPVGSDCEEPINCRVVAATNRSVEELMSGVKFREDLYYRLSVFVLKTKALSERVCDIEDIVDALGGEKMVNLIMNDKTMGRFDISGNVRTLQAQVRRFNVLGIV